MFYPVPELLEAIATTVGSTLVARISQQGTNQYGIIRATIDGPAGQFTLYKGFVAPGAIITSVLTPGVNNAQFTPAERIRQGQDVIGVWSNYSTFTGVARLTLTTDGGT